MRKPHEIKKLESLTDTERSLVLKFEEKFKHVVVPEDDPGFIIDVHTFCRFLRARNFDLQAATEYFERWMKWRLDVKPHTIKPEHITRELKQEKAYWHGYDKDGSPVIVVKIYNHDGYNRDFAECLKFALFTAESGIRLIQKEQNDDRYIENYVILYDARSIAWKNFDIEMCREFYKCAEMYPETLKKMLVIQPGFMFNMLYKMLRAVLDKRTASKIHIIDDMQKLHDHIDPEHIQEEFGGKSPYSYMPPQN